MEYRAIKMSEAVNLAVTGAETSVYMLLPITAQTTLETLGTAKGFVLASESTPAKKEAKKEPKQAAKTEIDHGKIVALYTATPPRSVAWIADEIGCSSQTVINHLKKEGIYKERGEQNGGNTEDQS